MNEKTITALRMAVAHYEGQQTLTPDEEAILNAAKDALTEATEQRTEHLRLMGVFYSAESVVDAINNDLTDGEHRDENGRSAVILQGIHAAREYLTSAFLSLVDCLASNIDEYKN